MTRLVSSLRRVLDTSRAWPAFAVALVITLAMAALNGVMVALMALGLGDMLPGAFAQMTHFTEPHHRTHDLTFGFLFVPAIVGILAQLRRPAQNIAGMLMALIPSVGLLLTLLLTSVLTGNTRVLQPPWILVAAGALLAMSLHPAGRDFFGSFRVSRLSRVMLGLVVIAAVPLLGFASTNLGLQGTVADDHAAAGHYGFMAAFGFTVIGIGALASLRADGWRITAWITGLLPVLLGVSSLAFPDAASSLTATWAVAAMVWGVAFVLTAELTKGPALRRESSRPPG